MDTIEKVVRKIGGNDRFANLIGFDILEVKPGYARLSMKVEEKHLNSLDITQGGAIFTLADTAFALASNSHGKVAVALNVSINFLKATTLGSLLTVTAQEEKVTRSTGLYRMEVTDETGDLVCLAEGLVFRKKDDIV